MAPLPEDRSTFEQLALLEPTWIPNPSRARQRLAARLALTSSRRSVLIAVTAAAVLVLAVALPQTRAVAQDLWQRITLGRVEVLRLDLSDLPIESHVRLHGPVGALTGFAEAAQKAGFRPHLPPASILPGTPEIVLIGPMTVSQTIRTGLLREALAKRGLGDVAVPDAWDGVELRTEIAPMVGANYPGDVEVLQTTMSLSIPPGFPLADFAAVALQTLGVDARAARQWGEKFAAHPGWLIDIPADELATLEELRLHQGPAIVIHEFDDSGRRPKVTVIVSSHQRLYAVSSPQRDVSIRVADSLP